MTAHAPFSHPPLGTTITADVPFHSETDSLVVPRQARVRNVIVVYKCGKADIEILLIIMKQCTRTPRPQTACGVLSTLSRAGKRL
jgi:hypothetical protein